MVLRMASCSGIINDGQCGICGIVGPLEEIESHFMSNHVHPNENNASEEEQQENVEGNSCGTEWGQPETKLLLDKYEQYLGLVGPMKKFRKKKNMWAQISNDLCLILNTSKSPTQCENRYKTVMKRKKKAVDNNQKSGNSRASIEYEEELSKIAAVDDSIEPEVLRDSRNVLFTPKNAKQDLRIAKRKRKTVQEVLLEITEKKEEAREKRHTEKMDLLRQLLEAKKKN